MGTYRLASQFLTKVVPLVTLALTSTLSEAILDCQAG